MFNNDYSSRKFLQEKDSWNKLKSLDVNKDNNLDLNEMKKLDTDNDGVISDLEFDNIAIKNTVVKDEINSRLPNVSSNKLSPIDNRVVFNIDSINKKINNLSNKEDMLLRNSSIDFLLSSKKIHKHDELKVPNYRLSDDIHDKYLRIKSILNNSMFNKFESALNRISNDKNKVNDFLDKTLYKIDPFSLSDAYKILSKVESKVPHIGDKFTNNPNVEELMATPLALSRVAGNRLYNSTFKGFNFENKDQMSSVAKTSEYLNAGNCGELAAVGAYEAKKLKLGKVEFFSVQYSENSNHNHVFIVLNRENNTNEKDPKSWGKNCIVLDPWTKETYPSKDFFNHDVMKGTTPIFQSEYKN